MTDWISSIDRFQVLTGCLEAENAPPPRGVGEQWYAQNFRPLFRGTVPLMGAGLLFCPHDREYVSPLENCAHRLLPLSVFSLGSLIFCFRGACVNLTEAMVGFRHVGD